MNEEIKVKRRTNSIDRTGEKHITNEGFLIEIIECVNSKNITVRFEDGEIVKNKYYYDILSGWVKKPNRSKGEIHYTKTGLKMEIIEYLTYNNCTVQFEDRTVVSELNYSNIEKGAVKNPNHSCIHGIGYIGQGNYPCGVDNKVTKNYRVWNDMLGRCYNEKRQQKQPSYKDCTVAEEWYNFQVFAKWYEENWKEYMDNDWHLDKDILIKRNKIYSPETCCLVPREVNGLFTKKDSCRNNLPLGVIKRGNKFITQTGTKNRSKHIGSYNTPEEAFQAYKEAKEQYIKEVAEKWKDKIDARVYKALINYQVEITD